MFCADHFARWKAHGWLLGNYVSVLKGEWVEDTCHGNIQKQFFGWWGEHIRLDRGEIFCCWLEDEGREEA